MMKKFAKWLAVLLTICLMLTACTPAETAGGSGEDTYSQEVQNLESCAWFGAMPNTATRLSMMGRRTGTKNWTDFFHG